MCQKGATVIAMLIAGVAVLSSASPPASADPYMGMSLDCGSNCTTQNPVRVFFSDRLGQTTVFDGFASYGAAHASLFGAPIPYNPVCYDVYADDPTALNLARRVASNVCTTMVYQLPPNGNQGSSLWTTPLTFSSTIPFSAGRHSISVRRLWIPWAQATPPWDYVSTIYFDVIERTNLTATGGTPQSAQVLQAFALPLQVTVKKTDGQPLANTTVTFTKQYAAPFYAMANLSSDTAVTNAQGVASVTATANGYGGSYSIIANAPGASAPVTFSLSNSGSPAHLSVVGGSGQTAPLNTAFAQPLQVRVTDDAGNPTGGVQVIFTPQNGPPNFSAIALLSQTTATTNASGIASITATANGYSGFHSVNVSSPGISEAPTFALTNHGSGTQISVKSGSQQAARLLNAFAAPLEVLVTDDIGTPASGTTVNFSAQSNGPVSAVLGASSAVTDNFGVARVSASANGYSGDSTVSATINGTSTSTSFALRNHGGPFNVYAISGTPQSATILSKYASPLRVLVIDDVGNPASGAQVTFAPPSQGASVSLSQQTATTAYDGTASVEATASGQLGAVTVGVTFVGGTGTTSFSLRNLPPAPVIASLSPPTGLVSGGTSVTISGQDFIDVTAVKFGATAATSFTVNNASSITAVSPAAGIGAIDVVVTAAGGISATSTNTKFSYVSPQSITFPAITAFSWYQGSATLAATASSGLAVNYSVLSGPCALSGNTVTASAPGGCTIAANQAGNTSFAAAAQSTQAATVSNAPALLDIDASAASLAAGTKYDAATDGIMVLRYLLGYTGIAITANATGSTATRDSAQIAAHLQSIQAVLDVNGDGNRMAISDGLLIVRYMLGLRGTALVGNVSIGAFSISDIENRISRLMP